MSSYYYTHSTLSKTILPHFRALSLRPLCVCFTSFFLFIWPKHYLSSLRFLLAARERKGKKGAERGLLGFNSFKSIKKCKIVHFLL